MKSIIVILFVLIASSSFAQRHVKNNIPGEMKYSAEDSVVTNTTNNMIHLYGKATFNFGNIYFAADKISIDQYNKQVVATGHLNIISVPMIKSNVNSKNNLLRYTFGDKSVSIE